MTVRAVQSSRALAMVAVASLLPGCMGGPADDDGTWREPWLGPDAAPAPSGEAAANGRTFYVRPSGDDASSGLSPHHSWRSIERVNELAFEPGDEVLFESDAHFEGTLRLDASDSGTARAPVRVSSYGAGRAVIEADDGDGVVITDVNHVIVEDLILVGGWRAEDQTGNEGEGVSAIGSVSGQRRTSLRLRQLEVRGFKLAGIGLHARPSDVSKNSGYEDVEISDCVVHDNADFGLLSDGPYIYDGPGFSHASVEVRRVQAHHNRGLRDKGAHTGSGIVLSDVAGGLIEHSIAHHNGEFNDHEGGGGFGIWAWDSDRIVIQYNEAYENKTRTADGGGFDLDGGVTNSVLQYNYSHGNQGAGFGAFQFEWARPFSGNRIQYNISQDDGFGILVWDGNGDMGSLDVARNVIYGAKPALMTYSALSDVSLLNNVFFGVGPVLLDVYAGEALTLQGNDYWTGEVPLQIIWNRGTAQSAEYASFEAFRRATGHETLDGAATGSNVDPGLIAAGTGPTLDDTDRLASLAMYQLGETSPLVERGVDPANFGITPASHDFFGNPSPSGAFPDVGVHELR